MKNIGMAVIFFCILIMALMFSFAVIRLITETQVNLGKGIYVLSVAIFLVAFIPPVTMVILIRKWIK